MPPQISLNELYSMRRKRQTSRNVCFDHIVDLCHRRIRTIASYGGLNAFYEIPGLIVGYPLFNIQDCMGYVIAALRRTGFLVQILPPPHIAVLYISWDPDELKPKKPAHPTLGMDGGNFGEQDHDGLKPYREKGKNKLRLF